MLRRTPGFTAVTVLTLALGIGARIGIEGDVKPFLPVTPVETEIYRPKVQRPRWATFFIIRTENEPGNLSAVVRDRLKQVECHMNVRRFATTDQLMGSCYLLVMPSLGKELLERT